MIKWVLKATHLGIPLAIGERDIVRSEHRSWQDYVIWLHVEAAKMKWVSVDVAALVHFNVLQLVKRLELLCLCQCCQLAFLRPHSRNLAFFILFGWEVIFLFCWLFWKMDQNYIFKHKLVKKGQKDASSKKISWRLRRTSYFLTSHLWRSVFVFI